MDCLLPFDIARLVYGYLDEEGCSSAAKLFMETSQHMKICMAHVAKGRRIMTTFNGLSLIELLDVMADVTSYVRNLECSQDINLGETVRQLRCLLKLNSDEDKQPAHVSSETPQPTPKRSPRKKKPVENATPKSSAPSEMSLSKPDLPSPTTGELAFQLLLEHTDLHEKLAENINKEVASKADEESLEKVLQKKIVENIINNTEKDPIFDEMLEELVVVKNVERNTSCPALEEDPVASNILEENTLNRDGDIRSSGSAPTLNSTIAKDSGQQTAVQTVGQSYQLPNLPDVSGNIVDQAFRASFGGHVTPPMQRPLVANQPVSAAPTTLSDIAQCSSTYVLTSSPMMVAPSVVIGTTFSGAAVRFTPTGPSMSRIRHLNSPSPRFSSIKVYASTSQASSPAPILPKPPPPTVPPGVPGQPIFHVPVTQQGIPPSSTPHLQKCVATVSLATAASPVPSQEFPPTVKLGARTRGGKVKSYPGRKKSVQTIGPSTAVSQSEPKASKNVCESDMDVLDKSKGLGIPDEKHQEEPGGNVSNDPLKSSVGVGSGNENAKMLVSETVADPARPDQVSTAEEVTKSGAKVAKSDEEVNNPNKPSSVDIVNPSVCEAGGGSSSSNPVCRTDATPQQGSEPRVKLRKRLSLSTPRRGSHVRTLEFKTPPKNSNASRKSMSSPKNKGPETRRPEIQKMLESVKKSELFKSPPKKEKKAWDADLRVYTTEEDVPTSVGLKRKYATPNKTGSASKSNSKSTPQCASDDVKSAEGIPKSLESTVKSSESQSKGTTPSKTPYGKHETDEDLVKRIQRDVLAVIDEEDIADLSSASLCTSKVDFGESPKSSPKLVKSPIRSPGTSSVLEIGDIGLPASTIKKLYRRTTSIDENSCTMDSPSKVPKDMCSSPKKSQIEAAKENLFASPKKSVVESSADLNLRLTPPPQQAKTDSGSPKVGILSQLTRSPNLVHTSPNIGILYSELTRSPTANVGAWSGLNQSPGANSLEGTLIKECRRIEESAALEMAHKESDNKISETPQVLNNPSAISYVKAAQKVDKLEENPGLSYCRPPPGMAPLKTPLKTLPSDPFGITPLKTPWKPSLTAPVEMTPLSKIISEETRLGNFSLLTPTIPPTPDYGVMKTQPGNGNQSLSTQKTPQSKTSEPPDLTPSPPKKLPKTPVVRLKQKPAESAAKSRKKKPTKESLQLSDADKLVAHHLELTRIAIFGSDKELQDTVASEPVKKKTAARKRKAPKKSVVNSKNGSTPNADDETTENQTEIDPTETEVPLKNKKRARKKKTPPKPKKESKTKPVNEPKPEIYIEPVECEVPQTKKAPARNRKKTQKSELNQKQEPKPNEATTQIRVPSFQEIIESYEKSRVLESSSSSTDDDLLSPQFVAPVNSKKQSTLTQFAGFAVQTARSSPKKTATKETIVDRADAEKCTTSEKIDALTSDEIENSGASEIKTADKRCKVIKPLSRPKITTNAWTESVEHVQTSGVDPLRSSPETLSLTVPVFMRNSVTPEMPFYHSPFISIFEYPPASLSPNKSGRPQKFLNDHTGEAVEVEEISNRRSTSRSSSVSEDSESTVKSSDGCNFQVKEVHKRARHILSSSDEDEPSQKPRKLLESNGSSSEEDDVAENRQRRRSSSIEEPSRKPKRPVEVVNRPHTRERRSSNMSSSDEEPSRKPKRPVDVVNRPQTRERRRVSMSSSDEEPSQKPRRPVGLSNDGKKKVEIAENREKTEKRRRSKSSSIEDEPYRKRRRINERVDHHWPRYGRRSRVERDNKHTPSLHMRSHSRRSRYSSSEEDKGKQKSRTKSLSYSRSKDQGRGRSRSCSPKRQLHNSTLRDRSKIRYQDVINRRKSNRERDRSGSTLSEGEESQPKKRLHEEHQPNKRLDESTRRDRPRNRYQEPNKWKGLNRRPNQDESRSRSRDSESRQPKKRGNHWTARAKSRNRYQELAKNNDSSRRNQERDESKTSDEDDELKKREDSKERQDKNPCDRARRDVSRRRYQELAKSNDSSRRNRERGESNDENDELKKREDSKERHDKNSCDRARRDRSRRRYQELAKNNDSSRRNQERGESNDEDDELKKREVSKERQDKNPSDRGRRDRSRRRYQELAKNNDSSRRNRERDESNDEDDELKKRQDSKERHDKNPSYRARRDGSRRRYQELKDPGSSRRVDHKETTQKPISSHQDKQQIIDKSSPTGRLAETPGHMTKALQPKSSRTPLDELEEGEISDESHTTIFQFSKNNACAAGGGTGDRLSSPVSSESRQKLLKNVNVDKFLSLLHGDAKSPLAKEEASSNVGS